MSILIVTFILGYLSLSLTPDPPAISIPVLRLPYVCYVCVYCTARQYSPLRRKFIECSINNPALSLLMRYWSAPKDSNFSAFYWSPRGSLVSIPAFRSHEGSTFTEKYRNKFNFRIGPKRT